MPALLTVAAAGTLLLLAYFTYARWLSRRVFQLDDTRPTPANTESDNRDFVATARSIVFGHHFTSIAGTGPIVGPAIAVMWGWLPALAWVILGCIFIGAVHDLGSIVVSMRNRARSLGDIAGDLLGPRARLIFLCILILTGWIVLAIFGLVIAAVLRQYPHAIFPVVVQIPLALLIGAYLHRKGRAIFPASILALALMYLSILIADWGPLHAFNTWMAAQPTWAWVVGLLAYAYVASVLPVWTLLQPRDYINALQLISALILLVLGLIAAAVLGGAPIPGMDDTATRPALSFAAPMIQWQPAGAPPLFPILFITIACGACSGFHCLVGSGTTSKQIARESDAQPVGYAGMLTEGFLATLVIIACAAGIGMGTQQTFSLSFPVARGLMPAPPADEVFIRDSWLGATFMDVRTAPNNTHAVGYVEVQPLTQMFRSINKSVDAGREPEEYRIDMSQYEHFGPYWVRVAAVQRTTAPTVNGWTGYRPIFPQRPSYPIDNPQFTIPGHFDLDGSRIHITSTESLTITGPAAYYTRYSSWQAAGGLARTVSAFVDGSANLLASLGIPLAFAVALMGVFVASFAATTMDTCCRLQRYVVQELAGTFLPRKFNHCRACAYDLTAHLDDDAAHEDAPLTCPECGSSNTPSELHRPNRIASIRDARWWNPARYLATMHGATLFAVITAAILAALPAPGQSWSLANTGSGGLILWPLFGATNQLLAGFAFIVIAAWLIVTKRPLWFLVPAACIMLVIPACAMIWQAFIGNAENPSWLAQNNWLLVTIASAALALEAWLIIEASLCWKKYRAARAQEADARA